MVSRFPSLVYRETKLVTTLILMILFMTVIAPVIHYVVGWLLCLGITSDR